MKWIIFLLCAVSASVFAEWTVLENCSLVKNSSNDGDSFVVECAEVYRGEKQHRFRLYFVDTAETNANSEFEKKRLKEQAAYWESDDPDFAMRMGMRAEQTVNKILRGGFTVYTRGDYAPSMGRPRLYALIKVKDRWLDEILAEEGLVRIYGKGCNLPDRTYANTHRARLRQLERAAKADRRNGWRGTTDEVKAAPVVFEPYDTVVQSSSAWIYSIKNGSKVTVLPRGTSVTVVAPVAQGRMRIRFKTNGTVYEGLCSKRNLEL